MILSILIITKSYKLIYYVIKIALITFMFKPIYKYFIVKVREKDLTKE